MTGRTPPPLALHGLDAVRFAQPVEVAGVLATALQVVPMRVELADNQRIGPVHRYDTATQTWVPNKVMPTLQCRKGQIALFQVPHIPYDLQAEVGKPPPDGPTPVLRPASGCFAVAKTALWSCNGLQRRPAAATMTLRGWQRGRQRRARSAVEFGQALGVPTSVHRPV